KEFALSRIKLTIGTEDKKISIDKDTLMQVLINLIKNGFESTDNAVVHLTVRTDKNKTDIIIEDNGPGFTEEKLKNSFEPFATTKKDGSGLGLVISHRIVNDHNGILELSNSEQGGGRVTITLPN
ncbi:MAG: ATP-binding protein, partial [Calditrichaeota bacterium]